jgi:uncharacterized protein DUF4349/PKD domain-containing protein
MAGMNSKYAKISLILVVTILVGGLLVAFFEYNMYGSFSAASVSSATSPGLNTQVGNGYGTPDGGLNAVIGTTTMTSAATATYTASSTTQSGQQQQQQTGTSGQTHQPSNPRFVEFFSNVTLRVTSPASALDGASAIAYSLGGYVAYSSLMNTTAFIVLRIPSQNYQGALSQVESLGTVLAAGSSSNDVTVKYTDLNATLLSLTTEQASLLKLLNQSTSINSTLQIESILQGVNAQVNEVQSEILQTQRLINYGTISLTLQEATPKTPSKPLTLKLVATPKSGLSPLSVTFNAIVQGGTVPYIVNYNFGDGSSTQGQTLIHTFEQSGDYNVTVTVTDSTGNVSEAWTSVHVASPPIASGIVSFPAYVGGLFLQVVEGIVVVAVVVLPIAGVVLLVIVPLRRRFGNHRQSSSTKPGPQPSSK